MKNKSSKRIINTDSSLQRYLSPASGMVYTGLSRGALMQLAENAGAISHVGRRVLIDKIKLDSYIEAQAASRN